MSLDADVIVVGAGPTGLMLACELRLAGASALVLERLPAPTGLSKALGVQGRGVDLLEQRGLLARIQSEAAPPQGLARLFHFGMIPLDTSRLPGPPPRFLFAPQAVVERHLEARALELGVALRRGCELLALAQGEAGVEARVRTPEGERVLRASYLVGCDGAHSPVRHLAGIAFPGTEPTSLLRLGDVRFESEEGLPPHFVALDQGYRRVITKEPYPAGFDRSAPMTLAELVESVRRTSGVAAPMKEARWLSRFTDASRQAERYRQGRVFLAGDAAHVFLPAGGPGLSTGLGDAVNLGWKLGAAVLGWAPPGLLDSYHAERHPAGGRVLMHTRAQGVLTSGGEHVAALRALFGELLRGEQALRHIVDLLQGADVRYPTDCAHPLAGRWVASGPLLRQGRGALAHAGVSGLSALASGWADRVEVVETLASELAPGAEALLLRPDGYIAWASAPGEAPSEQRAGLERALSAWFGAAVPAARPEVSCF